MTVNSAGSASNVNYAVSALRHAVQQEQVASAAIVQAGSIQQQASGQVEKGDRQSVAAVDDNRGATVNIKA